MLCELGPWKIQFCPTASFSDRRDSKFHHRQYPKSQGRHQRWCTYSSHSAPRWVQFATRQSRPQAEEISSRPSLSPSRGRSLPATSSFVHPRSQTSPSERSRAAPGCGSRAGWRSPPPGNIGRLPPRSSLPRRWTRNILNRNGTFLAVQIISIGDLVPWVDMTYPKILSFKSLKFKLGPNCLPWKCGQLGQTVWGPIYREPLKLKRKN